MLQLMLPSTHQVLAPHTPPQLLLWPVLLDPQGGSKCNLSLSFLTYWPILKLLIAGNNLDTFTLLPVHIFFFMSGIRASGLFWFWVISNSPLELLFLLCLYTINLFWYYVVFHTAQNWCSSAILCKCEDGLNFNSSKSSFLFKT